jgi:hypothetical protein
MSSLFDASKKIFQIIIEADKKHKKMEHREIAIHLTGKNAYINALNFELAVILTFKKKIKRAEKSLKRMIKLRKKIERDISKKNHEIQQFLENNSGLEDDQGIYLKTSRYITRFELKIKDMHISQYCQMMKIITDNKIQINNIMLNKFLMVELLPPTTSSDINLGKILDLFQRRSVRQPVRQELMLEGMFISLRDIITQVHIHQGKIQSTQAYDIITKIKSKIEDILRTKLEIREEGEKMNYPDSYIDQNMVGPAMAKKIDRLKQELQILVKNLAKREYLPVPGYNEKENVPLLCPNCTNEVQKGWIEMTGPFGKTLGKLGYSCSDCESIFDLDGQKYNMTSADRFKFQKD